MSLASLDVRKRLGNAKRDRNVRCSFTISIRGMARATMKWRAKTVPMTNVEKPVFKPETGAFETPIDSLGASSVTDTSGPG